MIYDFARFALIGLGFVFLIDAIRLTWFVRNKAARTAIMDELADRARNQDSVDEICARIERAWVDRRDRSLVLKLIREHPQHEDDLFRFFDALLLEELDGGISDAQKGKDE